MHEHESYGLWVLVILNSAMFIFFVFSFTKPKAQRDWRSLEAFFCCADMHQGDICRLQVAPRPPVIRNRKYREVDFYVVP